MKRLLIILLFVVLLIDNSFAAKLLFDFNDRFVGAYNTNAECVMARNIDINKNYGGNPDIKYKVFWEEHYEWWEIGSVTLDVNNVNVDNILNSNASNVNTENQKSNVIYSGNVYNRNDENMPTTEEIIFQNRYKEIVLYKGNNESDYMTKKEAIKKREANKSYVKSNSTSSAIIYNTKYRKETIVYSE